MIRANCRARFTAADFDFVVRTLARSQTDQVSLVDLLSDVETRDSILDHPRLVDAILSITADSCESRRNFTFTFCPARPERGRNWRPQALRLHRFIAGNVFARQPIADLRRGR